MVQSNPAQSSVFGRKATCAVASTCATGHLSDFGGKADNSPQFTRIQRNDWRTSGIELTGSHGPLNGLSDMELHLIIRLIVVVIALGMFLPHGWLALARRKTLVGKLDAIAKVVCFEQTAHY